MLLSHLHWPKHRLSLRSTKHWRSLLLLSPSKHRSLLLSCSESCACLNLLESCVLSCSKCRLNSALISTKDTSSWLRSSAAKKRLLSKRWLLRLAETRLGRPELTCLLTPKHRSSRLRAERSTRLLAKRWCSSEPWFLAKSRGQVWGSSPRCLLQLGLKSLLRRTSNLNTTKHLIKKRIGLLILLEFSSCNIFIACLRSSFAHCHHIKKFEHLAWANRIFRFDSDVVKMANNILTRRLVLVTSIFRLRVKWYLYCADSLIKLTSFVELWNRRCLLLLSHWWTSSGLGKWGIPSWTAKFLHASLSSSLELRLLCETWSKTWWLITIVTSSCGATEGTIIRLWLLCLSPHILDLRYYSI